MRLHNRLRRLEQQAPEGACPACRHRRGLVALVTARELPDGSTVPERGGPEPCARCGGVPERIIQIVEVVVESREDVARFGNKG
jgi:hypothetical protein